MRIQDRNLDDVLKHVRARFDSDLPNFTDCIGKAFAGVDVVFWRERYLEFYWKCVTTVPGYIQQVVAANAEAESAGSKGLFDLWTQLQGFAEAEEGVERHFRDESRHARLFVRLTQLAFPDFKSDAELFDWKNGPVRRDDGAEGKVGTVRKPACHPRQSGADEHRRDPHAGPHVHDRARARRLRAG
ncbi:hypothetical protein [Bradyrhizobium sp. USDA 4451]